MRENQGVLPEEGIEPTLSCENWILNPAARSKSATKTTAQSVTKNRRRKEGLNMGARQG